MGAFEDTIWFLEIRMVKDVEPFQTQLDVTRAVGAELNVLRDRKVRVVESRTTEVVPRRIPEGPNGFERKGSRVEVLVRGTGSRIMPRDPEAGGGVRSIGARLIVVRVAPEGTIRSGADRDGKSTGGRSRRSLPHPATAPRQDCVVPEETQQRVDRVDVGGREALPRVEVGGAVVKVSHNPPRKFLGRP